MPSRRGYAGGEQDGNRAQPDQRAVVLKLSGQRYLTHDKGQKHNSNAQKYENGRCRKAAPAVAEHCRSEQREEKQHRNAQAEQRLALCQRPGQRQMTHYVSAEHEPEPEERAQRSVQKPGAACAQALLGQQREQQKRVHAEVDYALAG